MNYFAHDDSALELNLQCFGSKYDAYTQFSFAIETFNRVSKLSTHFSHRGER